MPVAAGLLNQRAQFLRRGPAGFAPLGAAQWARLEFERAQTVSIVGVTLQGRAGRLTVRACDLTRGLKVGDRCELDGDVFTITIRKAAAVDVDDVHLEIESAPTTALYAEEIDRRGETIQLRRRKPNTTGDVFEAQCDVRAIVTGYAPSELVGGIVLGNSRVILLAADVVAGGFPLPLKNRGLDSVWINGRQRTFQMIDDNTHRVAGELLAYDCAVVG